MKKLLIASTALVSSAGFAAADGHLGVALSGAAEMGIAASDYSGCDDCDPYLFSSIDVSFKLSGETDGGLSFGGKIDLDEAAKTQNANETVYVKGGFGNLTMGDTDGASDWALTETAMGTAIDDSHTIHAGYSGNSAADSGTILRYDNTFGDFGVAVSVSDIEEDDVNMQIGLKYTLDLGGTAISLGLGHASQGDESLTGVSAKASVNGITGVINYTDFGDDETHFGLGLGYQMDALLLHINYGVYDDGSDDASGFGVVVNYDLGGGAVVALGYGTSEFSSTDYSYDTYSLGLRMDF